MEDKETGRLEAFSDGVFAVAITLLVLNIQPPHNVKDFGDAADALPRYLRDQWPDLLAFATSFTTIGVMWLNHHRLFNRIKYTDNILLALNLLLLFIIVFIPYPTALLAQQYAANPSGHTAAIFFTGTNMLLAICFNLLWFYASHHNRLLREDADPEDIKAISRQYVFGPFASFLIFGLAWINVPASILLNLLLALFFATSGRPPQMTTKKKASISDTQ